MAYEIGQTTVSKDRDGWNAETAIKFPEPVSDGMGRVGHRVLTFRTYKGNRGIVTTANVSVSAGGFTTTVLFGDYNKTLIREDAKATEKAVREQHARALQRADEIANEVVAFYAPKVDATAANFAAVSGSFGQLVNV